MPIPAHNPRITSFSENNPLCRYSAYSDMLTQHFAPFTVAKVELYHVLGKYLAGGNKITPLSVRMIGT